MYTLIARWGRSFVGNSVVLLVALLAASGRASDVEAVARFRKGSELIAENSGDSALATREGLIRGIEEVKKAIAGGYADRMAALRLLGDAWYRVGALGGGEGPVAAQARARAREAYLSAVALSPGNVEVLSGYASVLDDKKEQLGVYMRILAVSPNHVGALVAAGQLLIEEVPDVPGSSPRAPGRISERQFEEGVRYLKRAARAMDRSKAESHGRIILEVLESHGRKRDAEEVKREFKAKGVRFDRRDSERR